MDLNYQSNLYIPKILNIVLVSVKQPQYICMQNTELIAFRIWSWEKITIVVDKYAMKSQQKLCDNILHYKQSDFKWSSCHLNRNTHTDKSLNIYQSVWN